MPDAVLPHATPRAALLLRTTPAFGLLMLPLVGLLFVLPARLVFPPLGAAGRPSVLFAVGLALLWGLSCLRRGALPRGRQPVRLLVAVYLGAQAVSYAVGFDRGLPPLEARSADRWLIASVGLVGLACFVADAVPDRAALERLLLRVLTGAGFMASVGALQFLVGFDLTQHLQVPGLSPNRALIGIGERGEGFARVAGTASHYIEFGVVLAMLLPVALHYAFYAPPGAVRARRWCLVALLGSAVPFSVSRSGVLAAAVALGVLSLVWPWRLRYNAAAAALVAVMAYRLLQPGLLGTIRSLFTNAADDPSVQGRTDDYAVVLAFVRERPWLGRGAGTFMPERYILLDNQYLNTLVSQGALGLLALVALLLGSCAVARRCRLRARDDEGRHLGQAMAAALLTGAVSSLTFDALSFTSFSCLLFLLIGCTGAMVRLLVVPGAPLHQEALPGDRVAVPWAARPQPAVMTPRRLEAV